MKGTPASSKSKQHEEEQEDFAVPNGRFVSPMIGNKRSFVQDEEFDELLALDLEERRKRNIERNRQMLAQLFSIPASATKQKVDNTTEVVQVEEQKADEQESFKAIENKFPKFIPHIRTLSRYLSYPIVSSLIYFLFSFQICFYSFASLLFSLSV